MRHINMINAVLYHITNWLVIISGINDILNNSSVSKLKYGWILVLLILHDILIFSYECCVKDYEDKIKNLKKSHSKAKE